MDDEDKIPVVSEENNIPRDEKSDIARARALALIDWKFITLGGIGSIIAGGTYPAWGVMFGFLIHLLFQPVFPCRNDTPGICTAYWNTVAEEMRIMSFKLAAGWAAIVVACFIGWTMVYVGFGSASEGLNKRVRDMAFSSLCRQEVAYFDKRSVGSITSQLEDDTAKVHGITGQPLRIMIMNVTSVFTGIIVSLVFMWPVALILFGLAPMYVMIYFILNY
jgi:ATP-binding cassette subfamily B (MDR/TAP) protein 1